MFWIRWANKKVSLNKPSDKSRKLDFMKAPMKNISREKDVLEPIGDPLTL